MASRYPTISAIDYCFSPQHIVQDDKDIIVPCGKCDGCLLHKANEWSIRCGMEIEDSPATIFFTLTYDNKYLPKLYPLHLKNDVVWFSDHNENIRFDSVKDVIRQDNIYINYPYKGIEIQKWPNDIKPAINYASKRDIQLWLKLLRKDLNEKFVYDSNVKKRLFRYYIISEVGPTTYRNHYHGLLFCQSAEIALWLLEFSLYKNWKMCAEDRFRKYAHLCDSGARGYVTQYLTCYSDLPKVYREVKEIRPFRLASKSPAIGFISQNPKEIFENVSRGTIMYRRPITRLESDTLLFYPSGFMSRLFPKCFEFSKITDSRRFSVYSLLYREVRKNGHCIDVLLPRLFKSLHSQDYLATCAAFRFTREYINSIDHYYYLLDEYYYQVAQNRLKFFYQSQQNVNFDLNPEMLFFYYPDIEVLCLEDDTLKKHKRLFYALDKLLSKFGYDVFSLIGNKDFFISIRQKSYESMRLYRYEVEQIVSDMQKMPKHNELTGDAPTIV